MLQKINRRAPLKGFHLQMGSLSLCLSYTEETIMPKILPVRAKNAYT